MRVAIYTRLSPNPDKDDTESQLRDLVAYANAQNWEITKRYSDIHVSGSRKGKDRPQFAQMMQDARNKKFDILLFWSLDRLSREGAAETIAYLSALTNYGINYRSYTEQYIDSCGIFKDAVIAIMATIAKQERIRLIERTKAGVEIAKSKGVKFGRPRAVVDRVKIREMREQGISVLEIAEFYNTSYNTIYRAMKERV